MKHISKKDLIHVAFTIDKLYIQHLGVLLCSLFENNKCEKFCIHIGYDFILDKEFDKLKRIIEKYDQKLNLIKINNERVLKLKLHTHASVAVYYRLLLTELLGSTIEKVLYLDSDIIIKGNIRPLYDTELKDKPVAAVREPLFNRHLILGLSTKSKYFNSGVLLINLPMWQKLQVSEKAIKYIENNPDKIHFWDQDGLNFVLEGKWIELDLKWNQHSQLYSEYIHAFLNQDELKCALEHPKIIHFSSKFKPWDFWCDHPQKQEYFKYLLKTPWKNFQIKELSYWHIIKQKAKKFLNQILKN